MESEAFLANPKHQHRVSQQENVIVVLLTKGIGIILSIQVCIISLMDFDCEQNGLKNVFLSNLKHQYRLSQCAKNDCGAQSQKRLKIIMRIQV